MPNNIGETALNAQVKSDLDKEATTLANEGVAAVTKISAPVGGAAEAAVTVISNGGGVSDAFAAFENALIPIVDGMISAVNPIAGDIASAVLPPAAVTIAKAVGGLYTHIGAELPPALVALLSDL